MGNDPQEQQETLAIVFDELDRMSRLVNNLISLAKAERPDFLELETIDFNLFTQEIYYKIIPLAQRNWQLQITGKGSFRGDRQRLTQAFFNLVQNAIHHTKENDSITLGSKIALDNIFFWVQDTGEGFAAADQKLIFQRFARASNNHCTSRGQGLGLSIVEAIVQAHGGKVTAQGELGQGATFTLILPRQ
jgi:signal transduction histidine kinase